MGSSESKPKTEKKEHKNLYKLMKAYSDYNTDTNTINFSRKDLANTISDNSILDVIQAGGDKLKNIPSRDRYSKYETQQIKNKNQNLVGGDCGNQFSSVSEEEMQGLKHLVMHGAGCGCGENKVLNLQGGKHNSSNSSNSSSYNPLNSMTMSDSSKKSKSSNSSSYNPMNSITPTGLIGSSKSDERITPTGLIGSSKSDESITPTGLIGSSKSDESITMTNKNNRNMIGGDCSATSSYMPSQVHSVSATSYGGSERRNESATSSYMPSQVHSVSATSVSNKLESDGMSSNSNHNRLLKLLKSEQKGGNLSSSISTISKSESAINYHNLVGGQQDDDENSDLDESPSTTTTESTTTENNNKSDNTDNTESTDKDKQSRLERLSTVSKTKSSSKTRSSKASSTSSDSSSSRTTSTGSTTFDSSSSQHSSDTSSSSKSSTTDNSRISKNIYLSTTMSDGNVIDAKQFYSSDMGELYSSDTNFLRHNLTKRRFR
jgi:hypothetical protein